MICNCLQDYINIRADSAATFVNQNETGWLDLSGFQDVVAFLEVKGFAGAVIAMGYQTSPSKDETLFANAVGAVTLVTGLTTTPILKATATVPLARWFRWKLTATTITGVWDAYFRVWLACNRAGKRNAVPLAGDTRQRMLASEPSIPLSRRAGQAPPGPSIYAGNPSTFVAGQPGSYPGNASGGG